MGDIFRKTFAWLVGLGPLNRPFLIYQPTTINKKPVTLRMWFFTLVKVCTERIKNVQHHPLKPNRSHFIAILLASSKGLKVVFSPHNRAKTSRKCLS